MLDDYAKRIAEGVISVLGETDGTTVGLIVLLPKADNLLLPDNLAVRPDRQRRGLGRKLIAFAEAQARRLGFAELRLYTHEAMSENIALSLYARFGFEETGRVHEAGCSRVFMRKRRHNFP